MLIDLSLIPSGYNPHLSAELAKALQLVDASGLPYQLNPLRHLYRMGVGRSHGRDPPMS